MAIMSSDDVAIFEGSELATGKEISTAQLPATPVAAPADSVWVLCRKRADGGVESIRAFDDEDRACADLELVESVSGDQFWVSAVPLLRGHVAMGSDGEVSRVQALALSWMAQGAEAEGSIMFDDPVVVSPRHVRGFVSVPSHEWREMEQQGWVRDGLITPDGAAKVGAAHPHHTSGAD